MKKNLTVLLAMALLACLLLAACAKGGANGGSLSEAPPSPQASSASADEGKEPVTMLVAAAASLEYSFRDELIPLFEDLYPWITVEGSYDSSGKLQTQIEEGLEADMFMSAATKQMKALEDGGFIDPASVVALLQNEVVLITAADSDTAVTSFEDIASAETIAMGDPESVPAGQYAREALQSLGVYGEAEARASLGSTVTEVLGWVAEGSAEVGVVYATDAATNDRVRVIAAAPAGSLASNVIYPVGVAAGAPNKEAARLFVEFLQSPEAAAVFEKYGFTPNT